MKRGLVLMAALVLSTPPALLTEASADARKGETKPTPTAAWVPESEKPYLAVNAAVSRVNEALAAAEATDEVSLSVTYGPDSIVAHTPTVGDVGRPSAREGSKRSCRTRGSADQVPGRGVDRGECTVVTGPAYRLVGPTDDFSARSSLRSDQASRTSQDVESRFPVLMAEPTNLVETNRNNDAKPVYGGALIRNNTTGTICSVGIGVNVNGVLGWTTAQHCAAGTYAGRDSGLNVGTAYSNGPADAGHDIRFAKANTSSPRVWTGPWNSSTSARVYNTSNPAQGQRICAGGGITGEVCGDTYVNSPTLCCWRGLEFLRLDDDHGLGNGQRCIVNQGDSGSPVYNYTSTGALEVRGFTVLSDGFFSTAYCPNMHPDFSPNPSTSSRLFAVNVVGALNSIGATPTN